MNSNVRKVGIFSPEPHHTDSAILVSVKQELMLSGNTEGKPRSKERQFDFSSYPSRKIALRLAYHGHIYCGLVRQAETPNTVEAYLVAALERLRFVEPSGPKDFSRCGRTDKGVSALGNVVSFTSRASSWATDEHQQPPLDYCEKLNNVLPPTIRIVGWSYVNADFDARFSCTGRTYRYYFCNRGLNLEAMRKAVGYLKGVHNFRNFCKTDVVNVNNYERHVRHADIVGSEMLPDLVSYFEIEANSFLYNQIRCTMEVLFLVGRCLEEPEVVKQLLDCGDRKPVYPLADATPLVLWECHFEGVRWNISQRACLNAESELLDIATALLIRSTVAFSMRSQLFAWYSEHTDDNGEAIFFEGQNQGICPGDQWSVVGSDWTDERTHNNLRVRKSDIFALSKKVKMGSKEPLTSKPYTKLLDRETERTFEEEVELLSAKKRARFEVNMEKKKFHEEHRCGNPT
ncbi:pseudouridine synthase A-like protein, putative [Trypanosoma brucei gambiense DAL972]|uniref:Pseudouridine synthase A-like protein, putative n=2 Tax=Trypanosoma brucei TaxID=5691 RepID=C9ZQW8_TRYB9|nr:pseudouridine synthase A-like protein, putative [Trypanosoma brucei gambiense DAL972]CBH11798.1 pseudouridine synthase A-like protein, putative [Trypanosoma brucei gambiense DAL972]|eukprot:XP_011774083.1 pseudouridine synthase A-like protein, putative [Trypanosoma brucei gambiense DAL972]